ncbi:hypothetical protein LPJ61_003442 [Coemansia biformis]|uniref:Uncharacterized protein n=1 Tax=Coemansia biformis TaxID=1286918 RepID=A0A9W7Y6K3_9FUNG|nr:hypothetical protein LPJ61_003442 [Coemansia biformis]
MLASRAGNNVAFVHNTRSNIPSADPTWPTPIIPFISNGVRKPSPSNTPPVPDNTGAINVAGIASMLQDVFNVPPGKITIDGTPVAESDPGRLRHNGDVNVVIKDSAGTRVGSGRGDVAKGSKGHGGDDNDEDDDLLNDGYDGESEFTTHSLDVDRVQVVATATSSGKSESPQESTDGDSDSGSGSGSDSDSDSSSSSSSRTSHASKTKAPIGTAASDELGLSPLAAE